ncbi:MAG: dicarboxylate/amino acid:cation symporter [Rikenellaceae bacterium]|nr:dicarboxylate/amino acid:cation symporter [Rikenellaceae bacterium]
MKSNQKRQKIGLLPKILAAIALGIGCSYFFPSWAVRVSVTYNDLFGNFLGFVIPLIILGLVAPGIAELGKGAGKLLGITALLAYGSTVLAGLFAYFTCSAVYPRLLDNSAGLAALSPVDDAVLLPFFSIQMPPVMGVMSALILAFILGLGLAQAAGRTFQHVLIEFREVITRLISRVIIPLLPIYIFGIFLKMEAEGQVGGVISLFLKVILVIFVLHILLLLFQFLIAGGVSGKNPFRLLRHMLPAYMTALGPQSSAATIPVTLQCTLRNGVKPEIAGFTVPLCATIHLSGSTLKIVACAVAIMYMTGMPTPPGLFIGFILLLGITMVAAPGVPGGAIMAAVGVLVSVLGFDETLIALMIALYIAMDSFGTAANVTGDGAIAVIVERIYESKTPVTEL